MTADSLEANGQRKSMNQLTGPLGFTDVMAFLIVFPSAQH
jgi:hypothetical protein